MWRVVQLHILHILLSKASRLTVAGGRRGSRQVAFVIGLVIVKESDGSCSSSIDFWPLENVMMEATLD